LRDGRGSACQFKIKTKVIRPWKVRARDTAGAASGARYGFNAPYSIASAGGRIWVTNLYPGVAGGPVTELNAADGGWVATLTGGCYNDGVRVLTDPATRPGAGNGKDAGPGR
jgi:hypothetical protein